MSNLTAFTVGNFKAFGPPQTIPIRPITLVYGQNSAGKSSLLDAILLSSHLARDGVPGNGTRGEFFDHQFNFDITGNEVRLGEFFDFVHKKQPNERILLGYQTNLGERSKRIEIELAGISGVSAFRAYFPIETEFITLGDENYSGIEGLANNSADYVINLENPYVLDAIDRALNAVEEQIKQHCIEHPRLDSSQYLKRRQNSAKLVTRGNKKALADIIGEKFKYPGADLGTFPPSVVPPKFRSLTPNDVRFPLYPTSEVRFPSNLRTAIQSEVNRLACEFALQPLESLRSHFESEFTQALLNIVYCGAYRESIELGTLFPSSSFLHDRNGGTDRIGGWVLNERAINYVNEWIAQCSKSGVQYKVEIEDKSGHGIQVNLIDKAKNINVALHEVGSGVGQIIPVLLAAAAYEESLVCIKQPELHLHPALQADVADALIANSIRRSEPEGNSFLVETHSEHVLLRLLRRIKETRRGNAPEGLSLSSSEIAVLYVENLGDHSIVREMPVSVDGELIRDWPGGFFEEGLREVLY